MKRDSFVFYRSFIDAMKGLTDKQIASCMRALMAYALDGEEVDGDGVVRLFMALVKPQIDANNKRYENGSKGGRKPKGNQSETKSKPNNNQTETKLKPNVNVNVNDNVNVNVNKYKKRKALPVYMLTNSKDIIASEEQIEEVEEKLHKVS